MGDLGDLRVGDPAATVVVPHPRLAGPAGSDRHQVRREGEPGPPDAAAGSRAGTWVYSPSIVQAGTAARRQGCYMLMVLLGVLSLEGVHFVS